MGWARGGAVSGVISVVCCSDSDPWAWAVSHGPWAMGWAVGWPVRRGP